MEGKTVSQSYTEQVHLVNHADLNGYSRLFGGILLSWVDMTAGIVARRHAGTNITTAAIDNLRFIAPAHANDLVVLCGKVTWTGRTSMEVCVESYVESLSGERRLINQAFFVMVALDADEHPTPVPPLILRTEEEKASFLAAEERRRLRAANRT